MINSRDLSELLPEVRATADLFLSRTQNLGIDLLVTSTYRDFACQAELYARGRTAPGRKITNARPGQSWHNWRRAFDIVPMRYGKPVWGTSGADGRLWHTVGEIGESCGLEWAGRWTRFREYPHFQITGGLTLAQLLKEHPKGLS